MIFPNILLNYFNTSSLSFGIFISAILLFIFKLIFNKKFVFNKSIKPIFFILVSVFLLSLYSMYVNYSFNHEKFVLSYILIWTLVIAAYIFNNLFNQTSDDILYRCISIIFYLIMFDGIYESTSRVVFSNYSKELFFFSEASHFSLIYLPLLLFKVFSYKNNNEIIMALFISIALALTLPNLTLLVGVIFIMFIYSLSIALFVFIPLMLSILFNLSNTDYLLDRVSFMNPENLSLLVYLAGWERAYLSINEHGFFGIGFQQLGFISLDSKYYKLALELDMPILNLYDGASTGAKIVAELGIIGIILLVLYIYFMVDHITRIKKYILNMRYWDLFYSSLIITSSINIFVRGMGYFSPLIFLLLCSIIYFNKSVKTIEKTIVKNKV